MFPETVRARAHAIHRPPPPPPPPPLSVSPLLPLSPDLGPAMAGIGSRGSRHAFLGELDDLAQCLRIVEDLPALDALSRIEVELPAELDFDAEVACQQMLHQRAVLQSAVSLEGQRPVGSWVVVSADLRETGLHYARTVDAFTAELRDGERDGRPHHASMFRLPEPAPAPSFPPGLRLMAYLSNKQWKYKKPALLALWRDHPGVRFDLLTFDFAWAIVASRPHQKALELLQRNARQHVSRHAWGMLDDLGDTAAEAMRALRDWQYASYCDAARPADDPAPPRPDSQHWREPLLASIDDLCAISLFVYPVCPIARPIIQAGAGGNRLTLRTQ